MHDSYVHIHYFAGNYLSGNESCTAILQTGHTAITYSLTHGPKPRLLSGKYNGSQDYPLSTRGNIKITENSFAESGP